MGIHQDFATDTASRNLKFHAAYNMYAFFIIFRMVSGATRDLGATYANVDGDSFHDLILAYSIGSKSYYKVFFDITSSFGWSGTAGPYEITATGGVDGIDIAYYNMDGTSGPHLLVAGNDVFNDFIYFWATISAGGLIITPWQSGPDNGEIGINSGEEIGIQMYHGYPDGVFTVNFRDDDNYIKQNVISFGSNGGISNSDRLLYKFAPLKDIGTSANGKVGGGDMVNIGEQSYNDAIYSWVQGANAYYTIDWDSRLNSHG
jgi:hypothetical protein